MTIYIKGKQYKIKYTLRALFIFEKISGKLFKLETLTDEYIFFYCLLAANNPELDFTFDELINEMDEEPSLMVEFQNFMKKELEKQNQFVSNSTDNKKKF